MKTKPSIDPHAAFPEAKNQPEDRDLAPAIGSVAEQLTALFSALRAAEPKITTAWHFSSRAGWYQQWELKRRRLLYIIPKRGDVRLSLIIGDKAIAEVKAGPLAREFSQVLQSAKRYPEGTGFTFEGNAWNPNLVRALLEAKMNH